MWTVFRKGKLLTNYLIKRKLISTGYTEMSFPLVGKEKLPHFNEANANANANSLRSSPWWTFLRAAELPLFNPPPPQFSASSGGQTAAVGIWETRFQATLCTWTTGKWSTESVTRLILPKTKQKQTKKQKTHPHLESVRHGSQQLWL